MRKVLASILSAVLCLTAAPSLAGTTEDVAAFVQPTQAGRLAALEALLKREGLPYEIQTFDGGRKDHPAKGYNVVVTLGAGASDILLTAHYDAVVLKDGTLVGGVVDNAASVVALVQAAGTLKAARLKHRLRVIFFDQEELGLLGAKAYAAGPDGKRAAAAINFDVNGYGDTPFYSVPKDEALAGAVRKACNDVAPNCMAFAVYPPSDHLAFRKIGVPETSISILPEREVHQLWLMFNAGQTSGLADGFEPRALNLMHTVDDNMSAIEPAAIDTAARLAVELVKAADAAK